MVVFVQFLFAHPNVVGRQIGPNTCFNNGKLRHDDAVGEYVAEGIWPLDCGCKGGMQVRVGRYGCWFGALFALKKAVIHANSCGEGKLSWLFVPSRLLVFGCLYT